MLFTSSHLPNPLTINPTNPQRQITRTKLRNLTYHPAQTLHHFTTSQLSTQIPQTSHKRTPKPPKYPNVPTIPARSAHITPPARRRSASRAYARETTLPSSAKWGPFRCSFSERTRMCSQSDPTYRPYYPPILQHL